MEFELSILKYEDNMDAKVETSFHDEEILKKGQFKKKKHIKNGFWKVNLYMFEENWSSSQGTMW